MRTSDLETQEVFVLIYYFCSSFKCYGKGHTGCDVLQADRTGSQPAPVSPPLCSSLIPQLMNGSSRWMYTQCTKLPSSDLQMTNDSALASLALVTGMPCNALTELYSLLSTRCTLQELIY